MSDAPSGEFVSYQVDGQEKTVHIKPNVLCRDNMRKLHAIIKGKRRKERQELIQDLAGMHPEAQKAGVERLVMGYQESININYQMAINEVMEADSVALAVVLEQSTDLKSEGVEELLSEHPSIIELMTQTIASGLESLEKIEKNLNRLGSLNETAKPGLN